MDRWVWLCAIGLLAVAATGCLGDDGETIDPQQTEDLPAETSPPSQLAAVYRSNASGVAEVLDPDEALEGVPVPEGTARTVDAPLFEPTIGATSDGTLFVSNIEGTEAVDYSSILRSTDQGQTWEDVTGSLGPLSIPPTTGDPYVYVDEATDRVYNLDMIGLQCNWVRFSDDLGDSWTSNPMGCGQPPTLQDHPTIFAGPSGPDALPTDEAAVDNGPYTNVVYVCANRVAAEAACARSLDGGVTWSPWRELVTGVGATEDPCLSGLTGHGTTGPEGTVYVPSAVGYAQGCSGPADPLVTVSTDNGLTWTPVVVSEEVPTISHEVAVATDPDGTVYAFWISDEHQPYLAVSQDQGASWSQPVNVAPANVTTTSHPTIAAGEGGAVAMAYVGTDAGAESYLEIPENATWHAYLSVILDATADEPVVSTVAANDPGDPIARGICGGTRCRAASGAGLGDFIDVAIDEDGRPWGAFVDVCLDACADGGDTDRSDGVGLVGTLAEGPSLAGPEVALPALDADPAAR